MKWCTGSTAAQCMLPKSRCRSNASINWGLYELRLQKTHLSHIFQTALLFRKLRSWLCCQHQSTLQATVKDGDDSCEYSDQTLENSELSNLPSKWQQTISQVSSSTMFLSVYVFWDLPWRSCKPTSHHLSRFQREILGRIILSTVHPRQWNFVSPIVLTALAVSCY